MSFLRAIAVLLIVLGCAAFSQTCLITKMLAASAVDCCETQEPASQGAEKECAQCVTLESGVDRIAPEAVTVHEPALIADEMISALFARSMENEEASPELDTSQPAAFSPLWLFVARTALPVRGPSLIA